MYKSFSMEEKSDPDQNRTESALPSVLSSVLPSVLSSSKPKRRKTRKLKRQDATGEIEKEYWQQGKRVIIGLDEVGRGCMFGPVVAAACYVPKDIQEFHVRDSKALSHARRVTTDKMIREKTMVAIGQCSAAEIDELNIHHANLLAMQRAYDALVVKLCAKSLEPEVVLVDGSFAPKALREQAQTTDFIVRTIPQGDTKCYSIAAASIVAKVYRDKLMMDDYDKLYPQYKLAENKGYCGPDAVELLNKYGLTAEHRRSFAPCRNLLAKMTSTSLAAPDKDSGK
jgi:ribonuclease HII